MRDILEEIVANKQAELELWKQYIPMKRLYALLESKGSFDTQTPSMKAALMQSNSGIIAEFVRKQPGKEWINKAAKPRDVALAFEANGATGISFPTDFKYFGGYDEYIQEARAAHVTLPILYRNYIIDDYQLFQAKHAGASAVTLNAALLPIEVCQSFTSLCAQLHLEIVLEIHDESELEYLNCNPDMCLVNNRKFATLEMDTNISLQLAEKLPTDLLTISAGGITDAAIANQLRSVGYQGCIVDTYLMESEEVGTALQQLLTQINN